MAMWLSGCSFVFVSGPPSNHAQLASFSCSESRVAPVLDTIMAVLQALNFVYAASIDDQQWDDNYDGDPPIGRGTVIPLYAAAALLATGSAYYGYKRTGDCRDAKAQAMMRRGWSPGQGPYVAPPGTYAPPTQGPYVAPPGTYAPPAQGPYVAPPGTYAPPAQGPYAPPAPPPPGTYAPPSPYAPPPPPPVAPGAPNAPPPTPPPPPVPPPPPPQ